MCLFFIEPTILHANVWNSKKTNWLQANSKRRKRKMCGNLDWVRIDRNNRCVANASTKPQPKHINLWLVWAFRSRTFLCDIGQVEWSTNYERHFPIWCVVRTHVEIAFRLFVRRYLIRALGVGLNAQCAHTPTSWFRVWKTCSTRPIIYLFIY